MKFSLLPALFFALAAFAQEDTVRLDKSFKTLATFKEGADAGDINYLADAVLAAAKDPAQRKAMEQRLLAFLNGEADDTGKSIACRQLFIIGSPECVPTLAKLLDNERLSFMARYVLEKIPGEPASDALRTELRTTSNDKLKIGMIHSLGRRGDVKCVEDLIKLSTGANEPLAYAGIQALGKIDNDKAAKAVAAAFESANAHLKSIAADSYLVVAARYRSQGKPSLAAAIYEKMYAPTEPTIVRIAALQGLAATAGDKAIARLVEAMNDKDPQIKAVAVASFRSVPGAAATKAITSNLPNLPPETQAQLLLVLKDRNDATALPTVTAALKSENKDVRAAAIEALVTLGDASSVPLLAEMAANAQDKEVKDAARVTLAQMTNPDITSGIMAALKTASAPSKVELIAALGARGTADAVTALLRTATDADAAVRTESFRTLRKLADGKQAVALVALLISAQDAERGEAENAVVASCRKIAEENKRADAVMAGWKFAREVPVRASLLRVFAQIGDNQALPVVIAATTDADASIRDAAIRALTEWPNDGAQAALEKLARESTDETHKVLAMRGYIRSIDLNPDKPEKEKVALYEKALSLAARPDEKKLVLAKLSEMRSPAALKLAKQAATDEALRDAANAAAAQIEKMLNAPAEVTASHNPGGASKAIDGKPDTRWETGAPQAGGEWFMIDLGAEKEISKVTLDATGSGSDYPRGYELYVSNSKTNFGQPLVKGAGNGPITEIAITPKTGRYIKIVQTGKADGLFWSIHELKVEAKSVEQ